MVIQKQKRINWKKIDWKKVGFMASILAIPIFNFILIDLGGIAMTLGLGFFGYDMETQVTYWNWFQNFIDVFNSLVSGEIAHYFLISLMWYGVTWINLIAAYVISFYIYKKNLLHGFFRVLYFMPSVITGIVWTGLYKYICAAEGFYELFGAEFGLLSHESTALWALFCYSIWIGMCSGVLSTVGFMSGISPELVDASHIDGCGAVGEFFHVTLPAVWPFLAISLYSGVGGLFLSGPPLYEIYGLSVPSDNLKSFNYYLFSMVVRDPTNKPNQMFTAAGSLMITVIIVPLMYTARYFVLKLGPRED